MLRRLTAFLGCVVLSACMLTAPERATTFADGAILLQAPAGYCVDTVTSRSASDFAVMAPCATLGLEAPAPQIVGLVTAQAGAPESGTIVTDEIALRDFLITDAGRALLSTTGAASEITVLSTQAFDDQVMVRFRDQGPPPLAGLQNEEWRGFVQVDGRLVTISVRGLAAAPLQDGPGAALLKQVIAGLSPTSNADPAS